MNQITEVKLTLTDNGQYAVSVTKELDGGVFTREYHTRSANIHWALQVAKEQVTLTPANVATAQARGWVQA